MIKVGSFSIVEDTHERIDPGEVEGRGEVPGGVEDRGVEEVGGGDEEEGVGADEGGVGLVWMVVLGCGEEEPGVGGRVKGKGLVVLGGDVMDAMEEEPWVVGMIGESGERRRGDDGVP